MAFAIMYVINAQVCYNGPSSYARLENYEGPSMRGPL